MYDGMVLEAANKKRNKKTNDFCVRIPAKITETKMYYYNVE